MSTSFNRRRFVKGALTAGALAGLGDFSFLNRLPAVGAAEAAVSPATVQFSQEVEPLVRLIEDTPREKLLEAAVGKVREGTSYQRLLSAVFLAGVRNIQPRPVGFEFHCVLAVHAAHLAALAAADGDRWLALFWALDEFKQSQAVKQKKGAWTMPLLDEAKLPPTEPRSGKISSRQWTVVGTRRGPTGRRRRLAGAARPGPTKSSSCSSATAPATSASSATRRSTSPTPAARSTPSAGGTPSR